MRRTDAARARLRGSVMAVGSRAGRSGDGAACAVATWIVREGRENIVRHCLAPPAGVSSGDARSCPPHAIGPALPVDQGEGGAELEESSVEVLGPERVIPDPVGFPILHQL
jgi:hypothetical protein